MRFKTNYFPAQYVPSKTGCGGTHLAPCQRFIPSSKRHHVCWSAFCQCSDLCHSVSRSVSPAGRISTSPIRSVKSPLLIRKTQTTVAATGPEVPPPWKQEGYVASSTEAEMRETTMTSSTQIRREERWEGRYGVQEQVTISGAAGASVSASSSITAGAVATGAKEVWSELSAFPISPPGSSDPIPCMEQSGRPREEMPRSLKL